MAHVISIKSFCMGANTGKYVCGQMPVIIGGQSMQISDGGSHKSVGRGCCGVQCRVAFFKRSCCPMLNAPPRICVKETSGKNVNLSCQLLLNYM